MRIENLIDFNQHFIEIDKNKLGIMRKVYVDHFSFSPRNKRFSLVVCIKHYYTKIEIDPITNEEIETYGECINDMDSIIDIYDEFIGDELIMVYFNPLDLNDVRNGQILNPDRKPVTEQVPHISQYESIYLAFTTPIICLNMIKNLLNSYTNWKE